MLVLYMPGKVGRQNVKKVKKNQEKLQNNTNETAKSKQKSSSDGS